MTSFSPSPAGPDPTSAGEHRAPSGAAPFVVDIDGFEGPIDLLLVLARKQKVDLAHISILQLAEQYLEFLRDSRALELEIAADYLVTAAWLAYLKSRLLLPEPDEDEPDPEELAQNLAMRLRRLDAVRQAGALLEQRPRLGIVRLPRGCPEGVRVIRTSRYRLSLHELLASYGDISHRRQDVTLRLPRLDVVTVEAALERLTAMLGGPDWHDLMAFLPGDGDDLSRRSMTASSFAATLELARTGMIDLRQSSHFGPIQLRRRS